MPANRHLQWVQVREFGGLWTAADRFLMPANGAQVMSGCHPQPGGGLRAFYKPVVVMDTLGMPNGTSNTITGAFVVRHSNGHPFMLLVSHNTTLDPLTGAYKNIRLWSRGHLNSHTPLDTVDVWTLVTTGATFDGTDEWITSGQTPNKRQHAFTIVPAATLGADPNIFMSMGVDGESAGLAKGGLWEVNANPGTAGTPTVSRTPYVGDQRVLGPLLSHQARLVFATQDGISFSNPGGGGIPVGIGTDNNWIQLSAQGYDEPDSFPAWMLAVPPSDLLVGTLRGEVYVIQGDLADPSVRELGRWGGTISHKPVLSAYGPIVIFPNAGPTMFGLDGSTSPLAGQLDESIWTVDPDETGFGNLDFSNDYLFAPNQHENDDLTTATVLNNGALVFDFRTKAWFTSSHPDLGEVICPRWIFAEGIMREGGVLVVSGKPVTGTIEPLVYRYGTTSGNESVRQRASVWEWKSAPLRSPDGRRIEVRELHIGTSGFGQAGQLEVTLSSPDGSQAFVVDVAEGRATQVVPCRLAGEFVDISIKSRSGNEDVEAPMLDSIEIGFASRQAQTRRPGGGYRQGYATGY